MTMAGYVSTSTARHRAAVLLWTAAGLVATGVWSSIAPALAQAQAPPGDPPGNNGTIKIIADEPSDPDPGNEPQIDGCLVWLEFYGYDMNQQATIGFQAISPTGDAEVLTHRALISDDPAGGGQDKDATLSYNLSAALSGLPVDPDRGYHVKVTSDTLGAPGGAKQKVFWMRCGVTAPTAFQVSKSVEGTGSGPFSFSLRCNHAPLDRSFSLVPGQSANIADVPSGTVCVVSETSSGGATATRITETPTDGAEDGRVQLTGGSGVRAVSFTNVFAPGAVRGTDAEGAPGERLPETGTGTDLAAAAGVSLIVLGRFLVKRGRRSPERVSP